MIKNLLIPVVCLLLNGYAYSQPREVKLQMSLGNQNGLTVDIPEAESGDIEKSWKKYTKEFGKITKIKKTDELMIANANIPSIQSTVPMDLYAIITDYNITVFFDLKPGFLNSSEHGSDFNNAKTFM